ncbi:MAG TPA: alpha-L-rhamnosidase [Acidobacteriaceae bacterium]|nr:alpha-L-rhamnosidase [Acidobacteriaceae bacterium]
MIRGSAWLTAGVLAGGPARGASEIAGGDGRSFRCDDAEKMRVYEAAMRTLAGNVVRVAGYREPVLVEGSGYHGVWLECAPQEGLVWSETESAAALAVARSNHRIFFTLQKEDGQLPCWVRAGRAVESAQHPNARAGSGRRERGRQAVRARGGGPGFGQIQMVVPIGATAWELAERTGDEELLHAAYAACGRWDAWLRKYRNTRGTGLCEGFCTWDTGMDNSPRWAGMPNVCPDGDARKCPDAPGLPRLCPDLSATVYGGRVALAGMAKALGKTSEADRWSGAAQAIRELIEERLYDPETGLFYDVDASGRFVGVRSVATLRVLGEHVVGQELFETVWRKQAHNTGAFWGAYPYPSEALDDPTFVRPIPKNSWGGAAQALTALRTPRWMEYYGKPAELAWMMQQWVSAIGQAGAFRQQMDPMTGEFTAGDPGGYSPAALVLVDFVWRLSGVRAEGELLEWNVRAPSERAVFVLPLAGRTAELRYEGGKSEIRLGGRTIASVDGVARLMTTRTGQLCEAVGTSDVEGIVTVRESGRAERRMRMRPNGRVRLGA